MDFIELHTCSDYEILDLTPYLVPRMVFMMEFVQHVTEIQLVNFLYLCFRLG